MTTRISIDGQIHDDSARISVLDRGFLYGDSVYEVMRTYGGRPWAIDEHLERLERSARLLEIPLPAPRKRLVEEIDEALVAAGNAESYVRVIVTRGAGPISLDPTLATGPCRVLIVTDFLPLPDELYRSGARAHLVQAGGRSAAAVSGGAKSGNYLPNIIALGQAKKRQAHEALMLDAAGWVAEGSSSNVFAVADGEAAGELRTPPNGGILQGITRATVLELARQAGYVVRETDVYPSDLEGAREVFITSTLREVLPLTRIDDHVVGNGEPGPVATDLRRRYRALVHQRLGLGGGESG